MEFETFENRFNPEASTGQTVEELIEAGWTIDTLSQALSIAKGTIKNWGKDQDTKPIERTRRRLGNVIYAMQTITEAGVQPEHAAAWMQSPLVQDGKNTPAGTIAYDPEIVFDAIDLVFR
jgi:hypothetical protein